eukprot:2367062-Prorocentrum_lima.AAC.1
MPPPPYTTGTASSSTGEWTRSWEDWLSEGSGATTPGRGRGSGTGVPGDVPPSDWSQWTYQGEQVQRETQGGAGDIGSAGDAVR